MLFSRKMYVGIGLFVVACGLIFALSSHPWGFQKNSGSSTLNNKPAESALVSTALAEFVNVKGQTWRIPKGEYDFTVASKPDTYPQFISGIIDPLDVHPGDTQTMRIILRSDSPITSVVAKIAHDKGSDTVPLSLVQPSATNFYPSLSLPFWINSKGVLVLNSDQPMPIAEIPQSVLAPRAYAEDVGEYTYEGKWVVHDTHTATYKTEFTAIDSKNRTQKLELAWSDPICIINTSFTPPQLSENCTLSNADGIDAASLNLAGFTITLNPGGTFAFNSGQSISLQTAGSKIVMGGGDIKKANVFYKDVDQDGYVDPDTSGFTPTWGTRFISASTTWTGYTRMKDIAAADVRNPPLDCDESNAAKFQNWTGYQDIDNDTFTAAHSPSISIAGTVCGGNTFPYGLGYAPSDTQNDCNDNDWNVNPAATFHTTSGSNGWDYDCNGSITKERPTAATAAATCTSSGGPYYYCSMNTAGQGWAGGTVANCGVTANFYTASNCSQYNGSSCPATPIPSSFTQGCK